MTPRTSVRTNRPTLPLQARKKQAGAAAQAHGVSALLITHLPDVRWLSGFTGSNAALALICGENSVRTRLFTDGRYTAQARAEAAGTAVEIVQKPAATAAAEWLTNCGVVRCGFAAAHTTVASLDAFRKAVPATIRKRFFIPVPPLIARLREVKDEGEVTSLRTAALLGCQLFDHMLAFIEPGTPEFAVAAELEYRARLAGAEGMSFETIVASGERSSLPHGRASAAKLPARGFCTLDFGVILNGYCSDMTRTVHLGRASVEEQRVYEAVLEAQEAGVAAVREGVLPSDVDEAARSVLRRHKLDRWFTHSSGHGLGLEIHEGPRLAKQPQGRQKIEPEPLRSGMVVTIEPGVYLPGRFGVRIEDTVLVTRTGCEILTPATKAWIEL